jgi:transmembrane sensor
MTRDEYLRLFKKFLTGNATPEEIEEIMSYQDDFDYVGSVTSGDERDEQLRQKRILNGISASITKQKYLARYNANWIAAAVLVVVAAASLLFVKNKKVVTPGRNYAKNINYRHDVKPGANKALLTLENGRQIVLNDVGVGTVLKQGNITVSKQTNGLLEYKITSNTGSTSAMAYNTISTPVGGQYSVVLPDGSKVWLNAASSLKFPTAFTGTERKVELTGEGYFEIAKNKHMPFKVKFNQEEVEVLGTHFNVMAYPDEEITRTTLLEGSVKISKNNVKRILIPGQQAIYGLQTNGFDITTVNTDEAIAWKNGLFLFHNENIKSIMKKIARWYDVDVYYQGAFAGQEYGGRVSKSKNLSEILKNLELTGTIHFKIDGRRVTVME